MRKLFTLTLALMASFSLWAATNYTIYLATSDGVNTSNADKTEVSVTFNGMKDWNSKPITSVANETYGIAAGLKAPRWGGSGSGKNIKVTVKANCTATIKAYLQVNTADQTVTINQSTESGTSVASVTCSNTETVYKLESSELTAGDYYIKANDKVGLIKLDISATALCQDPQASLTENKIGSVNEDIDLEFFSLNTTSAVSWSVTLDSEAATVNTDYTITNGVFNAKKAGTFVVTANQEKNETYCAAEESVTLIITATPVSSVTISGETTCLTIQSITLTATTDVAATTIEWQDEDEQTLGFGSTYVFSPDVAGTYKFYALAENGNNTTPAKSAVHTVTVTVPDTCAILMPSTTASTALAVNDRIELAEGSTGGKIIVADMATTESGKESIKYTNQGLQLGGGSKDSLRVELGHYLKAGSVISVRIGVTSTGSRGFKLLAWDKTEISAALTANFADKNDVKVLSYIVKETDTKLIDKNVFILQRNNTALLKVLAVAECGEEVPDTPSSLDNTTDEVKAVKFVENGQMYIRRGEKVYTVTGAEVK